MEIREEDVEIAEKYLEIIKEILRIEQELKSLKRPAYIPYPICPRPCCPPPYYTVQPWEMGDNYFSTTTTSNTG